MTLLVVPLLSVEPMLLVCSPDVPMVQRCAPSSPVLSQANAVVLA